jgi:hypothetical protein
MLSTLILSFNILEGLKTGTIRSGNRISSPVPGFRAFLGLRTFKLKLPKPRNSIRFPRWSELVIVAMKPSITASVSTLVNPVACDTMSTMSAFVTVLPPYFQRQFKEGL